MGYQFFDECNEYFINVQHKVIMIGSHIERGSFCHTYSELYKILKDHYNRTKITSSDQSIETIKTDLIKEYSESSEISIREFIANRDLITNISQVTECMNDPKIRDYIEEILGSSVRYHNIITLTNDAFINYMTDVLLEHQTAKE